MTSYGFSELNYKAVGRRHIHKYTLVKHFETKLHTTLPFQLVYVKELTFVSYP